MWFNFAAVLPALPLLALAAPVAQEPRIDYDAIIVGGGPSGLSALSGLARVRRNVLLIDSGVYRNAATRHMHDVIGFDGVTPAYYRWAARQQIANYGTVSMTNGTVTKIKAEQNNTYFTVTGNFDKGKQIAFTAKKIVLGTGIRDLLPNTPGIKENWGQGIYWCPWCDGHEHADQPLGLIGPLTSIPGTVHEILSLNKDIIAFVNGTDTQETRAQTEKANPEWQDYLKLHNVKVENRTIAALERLENGADDHGASSLPTFPEHDLFRVNFTTGPPVLRAAFLTSFKSEQYSKVGEDLGVKLYGGRLGVDPTKGLVTSIPGVYAIGDANSDNVTNVPHAIYSGKRTAVYLHVQLERETAAQELSASKNSTSKRSLDEHARSVWDTMNEKPGDMLYAGEFDQ